MYHEVVPMGFETIWGRLIKETTLYHEVVPMGFETLASVSSGTSVTIMKLSLWDLKPLFALGILAEKSQS